MFRILLLCLGLAGCFPPAVAADDATATVPVTIVRLWTSYRDAASFARLGELSDAADEPGDAIVLRSQPAVREGFYFTIRLRTPRGAGAVLDDGRVVLHVVAPDAAQPRVFTFPFTTEGQRSVLLLAGLTGTDWTHGATMPLAWKLEIADDTGQVLVAQESFLWSKP